MNSVMKNSALNVKIHGKLKNRITKDMYVRMTNLKSVPLIAQFLKTETSWGGLLSDIETESIHRGFLEQLLSRGINNDIKELTAFTDISSSAFMRLFSVREEIENLKVFLRLLCSGHPERYSPPQSTGGKNTINYNSLLNVKSFGELLSVIDGTVYAVPLKGFLEYEERQNIFDMETALDIYYCEMVFKFAKKYLSREEYETVKETYGSEADLSTIMFIIRAKKSFDFPKQQMYPYARRKYAHLSNEIVSEMIEADTVDEVYEIISRTKYKKLFESQSVLQERKIEKYLKDLHGKMFKKAGYSIEAVLYYVKVREIELRNIITIIEGIRYGLEPEIIQQYLIGVER